MPLHHENALRLAREASANVLNGGASALCKANRLKRMGGGYEADVIVNRVYTHPTGRAAYTCHECGQDYVDPADRAACCKEDT